VAATAQAVTALAANGWRFRALVVNPADSPNAVRCGELAGLGPDRWEIVVADEPDAYLRAAAACRVVVAERLHAAVLAVRLGIPTVTIEYQPKCMDFLRSVGAEELSIRTDSLHAGRLVDLVAEADARHDELSTALDAKVEALRARLAVEAARLARRCGTVLEAS
jgi:polysaccharide pyruvyl transferase WcaK-like protein